MIGGGLEARRSLWLGGLGFCLALAVLRAVFLIAGMDPAEEMVFETISPAGLKWPAGPVRSLFDREELYTPTAAQAIGSGLNLPISVYRFMPYGGGSLILAIISVPIDSLFGSSYVAFKIIPLAIAVWGGFLWFLAVRRWFGPAPSRAFALLYAFAPSVLLRVSLIAKGDHAEAMAWDGAVLLAATQVAFASGAARIRWSVFTGLLAGLGVYLTYSTVPVLAGVGLVALIQTRCRPVRAWLSLALGGVVGLIPWLVTVITTRGEALEVYGQPLGSLNLGAQASERIQLLFNGGLLSNYDLPAGAPRAAAGLAWSSAVALGWIRLGRAHKHPVSWILLAATLAQVGAFCLRAPDASPRYLIPGYPLFLVAACALASPLRATRAPRWGLAVLAVVVGCGLVSQVRVVQSSSFSALYRPLSGTDWPLLGEIAGQKLTADAIGRLPDSVRSRFWVGFGKRAAFHEPPERWPDVISGTGEDRRSFWRGVGLGVVESGQFHRSPAHLRSLPLSDREAFRDGLASSADYAFAAYVDRAGPKAVETLLSSFDDADRPEMARSLARALGVLATQAILPREALEPIADRLLTREERLYGAGYSIYRGIAGNGGLLRWKPPPEAWSAEIADRLSASEGFGEAWRGVAEAYGRDLGFRHPRWILGGDGPRELARELDRLALRLPAGAAPELYRAAGRACADAFRHPMVLSSGRPYVEAWRWEPLIPASLKSPFEEGLRSSPTM
jgi:hypothetical protein